VVLIEPALDKLAVLAAQVVVEVLVPVPAAQVVVALQGKVLAVAHLALIIKVIPMSQAVVVELELLVYQLR
jgi:hypothetical protein